MAKALDNVELQLGHQTLFPFVVQPRVASGTTAVDVPLQWIWDIHASLPQKWENLRLAKIKRLAGENGETAGYSGWLRLIFTAQVENSTTEVAILYADYQIDSNLTYQLVRLNAVDSTEESSAIASGEAETVTGFITFQTLDTTLTDNQAFLDLVEPPSDGTDANSDGLFDNPAIYEIVDTIAGGASISNDFSTQALSHGTGLLTDGAWNAIPQLDSDIQSWITSFNYPFDSDANRTSIDGITIPNGLFREFDITAPAGDQPSGDVSGMFYPVYISRIEKVGTTSTGQLRLYFATFNITDTETGGSPSTEPIEFASLDLLQSAGPGEIVEIVPVSDLLLATGSDASDFEQHFGRGHVVLSSVWGGTTTTVDDFFAEFDEIVDTPADTEFSSSSTRISSFGISRVPKYVPTIGQSRALTGSTARFTTPINPGYDNRYICELDQGVGNEVDLEAQAGIVSNTNIDRYGYSGALAHKIIKLVINAENLGSDSDFYDTHVLPRLQILLGRDPQFGDFWYNGTRLMFFNGDTWQS